MSHGIMESDCGVVYGTTWHGIESYIQQDEPVTAEQCRGVLDYDFEKRELVADRGNGELEPTGVYEAYRTDTGDVLIASTTESYDLINNVVLFDHIDEVILKANPGIEIESVGTLFNGQTAFVNLLLGKYQIKGDESETLQRLMYYNPIGKGSYKTCAHNVRVVCNNTLTAAHAQGKANKTLTRVRHTQSAQERLEVAIEDILEINQGFKAQEEQLAFLATKKAGKDDLRSFVEARWFYQKPSEKRVNRVVDKVVEVYDRTANEYAGPVRGSRYHMLQSVTDLVDHTRKKSTDVGYAAFDGLVGIRAGLKNKFFDHMMSLN